MHLQAQWRLGANSFQPLTWKKIQSLLHNSVKLNSFSPYFPGCCEAAQDVISVSQKFLLVHTPAPLSPSLTSSAISFLKCLFIWLYRVLVAVHGYDMWDLIPWPGIKPGPPALGVWCLSHCTTGEVPSATSLTWCAISTQIRIWISQGWKEP